MNTDRYAKIRSLPEIEGKNSWDIVQMATSEALAGSGSILTLAAFPIFYFGVGHLLTVQEFPQSFPKVYIDLMMYFMPFFQLAPLLLCFLNLIKFIFMHKKRFEAIKSLDENRASIYREALYDKLVMDEGYWFFELPLSHRLAIKFTDNIRIDIE